MSELKPCPFCGGKATIEHKGAKINGFLVVQCSYCGANSKAILYKSVYNLKYQDAEGTEEGQLLVERWNRRCGTGGRT